MKIINNEEIKLAMYGWREELLSCNMLLLLVCAILFYVFYVAVDEKINFSTNTLYYMILIDL